MKAQLLTKMQTVEVKEEQTLKSILLAKMKQLNMNETTLETVAKHLLFSVAGVMIMGVNVLKKLDTVIKEGQVVKLLPARKAG